MTMINSVHFGGRKMLPPRPSSLGNLITGGANSSPSDSVRHKNYPYDPTGTGTICDGKGGITMLPGTGIDGHFNEEGKLLSLDVPVAENKDGTGRLIGDPSNFDKVSIKNDGVHIKFLDENDKPLNYGPDHKWQKEESVKAQILVDGRGWGQVVQPQKQSRNVWVSKDVLPTIAIWPTLPAIVNWA